MRWRVLSGPVVLALLLPGPGLAYQAGVFAIGVDDSTCVAPGLTTVEQCVWVRAEQQKALVYVTLRLDFPDNVDRRTPAVFDDRVVEVIRTDYPDGTEEWNLVLRDCPVGWVRVFRQRIDVRDDTPSTIAIHGADSWIRDCDFELHRVDVVNDLSINDPGCVPLPTRARSWSVLKADRTPTPVRAP